MNPAYTGYREALNATLIHRSQWIGFEGAPSTQSLTFEMPSKKDEIAYGGAVSFDRIGPTSELNLSGDFAYRIRLRNRNTLSFGAKASMALFQNNLTDLSLISDYYGETDENFMVNTSAFLMPNAGFGVYYYTADFYVGLSSPRMLRTRLDKRGTLPYQMMEGRIEPTYYFMTGKLWKLNRDLSIQPNLLVQATMNAPISFGAHVNMIYMDQLTAGLFYRLGESLGAIAQWKFNNEWKVGYSLDLAANQLIQTNYGSHEFMVNYTLNSKRKRIVYPRYF
jgi:type IX secretion system PorP/SprF family membrane protein